MLSLTSLFRQGKKIERTLTLKVEVDASREHCGPPHIKTVTLNANPEWKEWWVACESNGVKGYYPLDKLIESLQLLKSVATDELYAQVSKEV
jgi:hypothetical protein